MDKTKMITIVVKNSLFIRMILQRNFWCYSYADRYSVLSDNKEYLMLLPYDRELIDDEPCKQYMSCDREYYEKCVKDNPYCEYVEYLDDFIDKVKNLYK